MTQNISHSVKSAMAATGMSRSSIYKAFIDGKLTRCKFGKRTFILDDDLRSFVAREFIEVTNENGEK